MKTRENKAVTTPEEDYRVNFMPAVHRIGRTTMAIAFLLSFLPVAYFVVVRGLGMPLESYLSVAVAIASVGIGMWLTEPEAYWPVLGSAGTYMSYLSGSVGGLRLPVAVSVQSETNADINTPKGQVITIIGLAASVVSNLVLLLITVVAGTWIISVLPQPVVDSFAFVVISLLGSMVMMRWNGSAGLKKGVIASAPFMITAIVLHEIISRVLPSLGGIGMAIAVGICALISYLIFRRDLAKIEAEEAGK